MQVTGLTLTQLEAEFLQAIDSNTLRRVDDKQTAQGIIFLCPTCFVKNNGAIGTHRVICWSPLAPDDIKPLPGRWNMEGKDLDDLTLVAGSSSVSLQGGCNAHFFVREGKIVNC